MSLAAVGVILAILLLDGAIALFIVAAAGGFGLALVRALGLGGEPLRWRVLLGAGLGLGAVALWVLGLGAAGVLGRGVWIAVLVVLGFGGLCVEWVMGRRRGGSAGGSPSLKQSGRSRYSTSGGTPDATENLSGGWMRWLWVLAGPFAGLALAAAACPPGYLWPAEGNGYDVLEYHFGAPKEYLLAGRIESLPHNLYSYFPLNAEMLYLLAFVVRGSAHEAVYSAQLVNVLLAALAVAGAWLAGREISPAGGVLAGLAVATCPFVTYLCGVAYVENGMLAMTMLSTACLVRAAGGAGRRGSPAPAGRRLALAGGLLAGLACGFKYTAAPMVALPLGVCWVGLAGVRRVSAFFVLGVVVAFSPWLVRNAAATGNPVFPMARNWFPERAGVWSDEGAARWAEGHRPAPEERSVAGVLSAGVRRIALNPLYGPGTWGLTIVGLVGAMARARGRDEEMRLAPAVVIAVALGLGVLCTWGFTHLVDRFAYPLLAAAAIGWALCAEMGRTGRRAAVALAVAAAAWNVRSVWRPFAEARVFDVSAFGAHHLMREGQWPGFAHVPRLNAIIAAGGRPLMVGEARAFWIDGRPDYCVVFNRNPFAEAVAARPGAWIEWLRERGYTHVYVDWGEVRRLSRSRYGFWASLAGLGPEDYEAAGLTPVETFAVGDTPYATLFGVPRAAGASSPP